MGNGVEDAARNLVAAQNELIGLQEAEYRIRSEMQRGQIDYAEGMKRIAKLGEQANVIRARVGEPTNFRKQTKAEAETEAAIANAKTPADLSRAMGDYQRALEEEG